MATGALFIGWGPVIAGREQKAFEVFNEGVQYIAQLQQQGTIESFEPVALEPHGGDLLGFILIRGDREQLSRLRTDAAFLRLITRAGLVVANTGVVGAFTGEELQRYFLGFQQQAAELGLRAPL